MGENSDAQERSPNEPTMTPDPKSTDERRIDRRYQSNLDTAMYLLAHRRRRLAIEFLRERDRTVPREELVDWIATVESGNGGEDRTIGRERDIRLEVIHTHVPKLVAAGVVEETEDGYAYVGNSLVERLIDSLDEYGVLRSRRRVDEIHGERDTE